MTLDEFFAKLPRDGWVLEDGEYIRKKKFVKGYAEFTACPICVLDANEAVWSDFEQSAKRLGIRRSTAARIANAADGQPERGLRKRLLQHCGLSERGK